MNFLFNLPVLFIHLPYRLFVWLIIFDIIELNKVSQLIIHGGDCIMEYNNYSIGVLDSGVGGLTVVKEIQRQLPKENIVYFGDSLNMPYGNMDVGEIIGLTKKIISFIEAQKVKVIIIACNTISSQIENLIPLTDIPVFDIIYPGCLAAIEDDSEDGIGLIATEATVKANLYGKTLNSLNPNIPFYPQASHDLARIVEKNNTNTQQLEMAIKEAIDPILLKAPVKNLILGCTHYPIVSSEITKLYPQLKLIDPAVNLVEIVKGYLENNNILSNTRSQLKIYTSGEMDGFLPFIDRLGIKNYTLVKQVL